MKDDVPLDALIVGAGFSGVYMLNSLRSHGFRVKLFEAGGDMGGTWYWNNYPGARVDSEHFFYQFSDPKLYSNFEYPERFPGRDEVLKYFNHLEETLHLKKDITFNNTVSAAKFNEDLNMWEVTSNTGITRCRHLLLCIGFASKSYRPTFKGLDNFKGELYHSAHWPLDRKVDCRGKRVGVIGTGASGVQVVQEVGPVAQHLTVYQRTPNLALPMRQCELPEGSHPKKEDRPGLFIDTRNGFAGMTYQFKMIDAHEETPEERRQHFESLWNDGGFNFWLSNYQDLFTSQEANDAAYAFWAEKTRERLQDPKKKDILAPLNPPHPFGTKRPCLEQNFYEVLNQDNVDIIDVNASPIVEVTETGVKTKNEGVVEFDILVLATGFDAVTGSILKIDIQNAAGEKIPQKWADGTSTYLGMTINGFPNMYFTYGPQAPTAFSNAPTCVEVQGEWLTRLLLKMREAGEETVEAQAEAASGWVKIVRDIWDKGLFPLAKSWYQGANIPGKRLEPLNYAGGMPAYVKALAECEANEYVGFKFA